MVQTTMADLFQDTKQRWLDEARQTARKIIATTGKATIEDVLEQCPRPTYLHRNVTGSVFQHEDFEPVGFTASRRKVSHGRVVRVWQLKHEPYHWGDI
mgnify:CR=1 FL=1